MKKKLFLLLMATTLCTSLVACSLKPDEGRERTDGYESNKDDEESKEGFESSDDVITAYWQAYADVKKSEFKEVFPSQDLSSRSDSNIDDIIDESYDNAKSIQDYTIIDVDNIEIDSENYDVDDLDSDITKAFDIEKAKLSTVTVPLTQTIDGTDYEVEDIYEIITIRIDGNWYIINVEEIEANIVNYPSIDTPAEDIDTPTEEVTLTEDTDSTETTSDIFTESTEYNKVNWGTSYTLPDYDGITVSVTPYVDAYNCYNLVVGVTSEYTETLTLSAEVTARDDNGNDIGDSYIYLDLGEDNTSIFIIHCDDDTIPNGELHWEDIRVSENYKTYVPWSINYSVDAIDNNDLSLTYTIMSNEEATPGYVYGLLLDPDGYVIDVFDDYVSDTSDYIEDEDTLYRQNITSYDLSDIAIFTTPTK